MTLYIELKHRSCEVNMPQLLAEFELEKNSQIIQASHSLGAEGFYQLTAYKGEAKSQANF